MKVQSVIILPWLGGSFFGFGRRKNVTVLTCFVIKYQISDFSRPKVYKMAWFSYNRAFRKHRKDFIIYLVSFAFFHPHFIIRIIRILSTLFYHPHFIMITRILLSATASKVQITKDHGSQYQSYYFPMVYTWTWAWNYGSRSFRRISKLNHSSVCYTLHRNNSCQQFRHVTYLCGKSTKHYI